jgi:hypothetical protein
MTSALVPWIARVRPRQVCASSAAARTITWSDFSMTSDIRRICIRRSASARSAANWRCAGLDGRTNLRSALIHASMSLMSRTIRSASSSSTPAWIGCALIEDFLCRSPRRSQIVVLSGPAFGQPDGTCTPADLCKRSIPLCHRLVAGAYKGVTSRSCQPDRTPSWRLIPP